MKNLLDILKRADAIEIDGEYFIRYFDVDNEGITIESYDCNYYIPLNDLKNAYYDIDQNLWICGGGGNTTINPYELKEVTQS